MKILSWNCRGLGNPRAVQVLKDLVVSYKPLLIFLIETKCMQSRLDFVRALISFDGAFCVNVVGLSGGLALL